MVNATHVGYRPNLEAPPDRIRKLPIYRGYPVPWFVQWVNVEGPSGEALDVKAVPEFRAMDLEKFVAAIKQHLCWVCGETLGVYQTFVAGPMCGINRTSAEPPSHLECASWSVRNCPFLSDPLFDRREGGAMEGSEAPAGYGVRRNPGVTLLWTCKDYKIFDDGAGRPLLRMGEPTGWEWWRERRAATKAEVLHSIATGLPELEKLCQGDEERRELRRLMVRFAKFLPTV